MQELADADQIKQAWAKFRCAAVIRVLKDRGSFFTTMPSGIPRAYRFVLHPPSPEYPAKVVCNGVTVEELPDG